MIIFKILKIEEFYTMQLQDAFDGSPSDLEDGFIHFSMKQQIRETLKKHFILEKSLILMAVDASKLGKALKWENSHDNQQFPHFYGSLKLKNAIWYAPLELCGTSHILPTGF